MDNPATWTDEAQVYLVAAQLVVLIVAVIFAWRQVREARVLREEQSRPFVVVDIQSDPGSLVYLEVVNMGTSLARDVRIEIDPPLESAIDIPVGKLKMLSEGIATLAPGKKYRSFFDQGPPRNNSDLPMSYVATVTYTDEKGKRPFKETMSLDLDLYMDMTEVTRYGEHEIHERLKEIRDIFRKWTSGIGSGVLALSLEESREEGKQRRGRLEERERQREDRDES